MEEQFVFMNCTGHEIVIQDKNNRIWRFNPSGELARVESKEETVKLPFPFSIRKTITKTIVGLPEKSKNTYYIVSNICLEQAKKEGRVDCVCPNYKGYTRDKNGKVIYVQGFMS